MEGAADLRCQIFNRERLIVIAVFNGLTAGFCIQITENKDRHPAEKLAVLCNALHNLLNTENTCAVTDMIKVIVVYTEQLLFVICLEEQALTDTRTITLDRITGARFIRGLRQPEKIHAEKCHGFCAHCYSQTFAAEIRIALIINDIILRFQIFAQKSHARFDTFLETDHIRLFGVDLLEDTAGTVREAVDIIAIPHTAQIITDDL